MDSIVKANFSLSFSCNGVVKKQSFKSIVVIANPAGIMVGEEGQVVKLPWFA
jgi:filamentous hemagglutinin family protein